MDKKTRHAEREAELNKYLNGHRKIKDDSSWVLGFERSLKIGSERLGLSEDVIIRAIIIGVKFHERGLTSGKSRIVIAGACLYAASILEGDKRPQWVIANALNITAVSMRKRFREIVEALGIKHDVEAGTDNHHKTHPTEGGPRVKV